MEARRCPILFNWGINNRGECKRHEICDESRHVVCKANPVGYAPPRIVKGKGCTHDNVKMTPTGEVVKIKGIEKKVYLSICSDCGYERKVVE